LILVLKTSNRIEVSNILKVSIIAWLLELSLMIAGNKMKEYNTGQTSAE
jgi:hypothetical protein